MIERLIHLCEARQCSWGRDATCFEISPLVVKKVWRASVYRSMLSTEVESSVVSESYHRRVRLTFVCSICSYQLTCLWCICDCDLSGRRFAFYAASVKNKNLYAMPHAAFINMDVEKCFEKLPIYLLCWGPLQCVNLHPCAEMV